MNHLSSQQISSYLIGEVTPEEALHTRACAACRAQLEELEVSLSHFRGAVRQWAVQQEEVRNTWGIYRGHEMTAGVFSLLIHAGVVGLLLFLGTLKPVRTLIQNTVD